MKKEGRSIAGMTLFPMRRGSVLRSGIFEVERE